MFVAQLSFLVALAQGVLHFAVFDLIKVEPSRTQHEYRA
jgi:hypothetical protein